MLQIRPNCEWCDRDLAADSTQAWICSYECTFCSSCVENILHNVCPNCGGGFSRRPIRPRTERREGVGLSHQAPSQNRIHSPYSADEIAAFVDSARDIAPEKR